MHVMIVGGGVAGLEAVLGLSELAGELVDIELLSPNDDFIYRPMLVAEPFGAADVLTIELGRVVKDARARHTKDTLISVDPGERTVTTASGKALNYDALLIAVGTNPVEAVPGALTFSGGPERRRFADLLQTLGRKSRRRLAFVVPRGVSWSIAAYELALLTAAERDARRLEGVEITLVTHEAEPLGLFGAVASQLVAARLQEAGISLRLSTCVERFDDGELLTATGESLSADAAVGLPALKVSPIPGLPQQQNGFVQTDVAMHVAGLEAVWVAGDATSFPIKQGGLAAQQADVAARSIAARAGAHVPIEAFQPVLRGLLITGGAPEFLRSSRAGRGADIATVAHELWSPSTKVAAKYLGPYLAGALGQDPAQELVDLGPSSDPGAEEAAHERAVSLLLAAANGDARAGDYESAIKWLSLVEQLNLVIPPEYVARRHQWRRELHPDLEPDAAAERIDPTFAGTAAAMTDLQKRLGWLREIEQRTGGEMREHLSTLDKDMDHLLALCRQTKVLE
jgi:sulfide:quinone oxidoreductase